MGGPAPGKPRPLVPAGAVGPRLPQQTCLGGAGSGASSSVCGAAPAVSSFRPYLRGAGASGRCAGADTAMWPAGSAAIAASPARDLPLCGEPPQAPSPPASQLPLVAPSGLPLTGPGSATLNRLPELLLRRLSGSLDRAPEGRGWRRLAELAGSRGRLRLR